MTYDDQAGFLKLALWYIYQFVSGEDDKQQEIMIVKFITVRFRELANDPLAIVIYRFCIIIFASMSYPNFSSLTLRRHM